MLLVSIQQEDKMDTISWKDLIESSIAYANEYGVPEDLYVDPTEIDYDSWESSTGATSSES